MTSIEVKSSKVISKRFSRESVMQMKVQRKCQIGHHLIQLPNINLSAIAIEMVTEEVGEKFAFVLGIQRSRC